jgi:hypothetical protein
MRDSVELCAWLGPDTGLRDAINVVPHGREVLARNEKEAYVE